MSMTPDGRVVPANIELGETPKALVLKRAADFIQQMTQQTVRHEEAREQLVSRLENWNEARDVAMWAQSIRELAEADRQLAEGVAQVVAAIASVSPDEIKMTHKPKPKLTDFAGMSKAAISRELGASGHAEGDVLQEKYDAAAEGFEAAIDRDSFIKREQV